jgi:hypothetical protein
VRETIESEGVNRMEVMMICLFPSEEVRFCVFPFRPIDQQGRVLRRSLSELSGETAGHRSG